MEKRSNKGPQRRQFSGSRSAYSSNRNNGGYQSGSHRRFSAPSRNRSRFGEENISHSKFIQKAVVTEEEVFKAEHLFSDFNINEKLKQVIVSRGYTTPTPLQDKIIPHILFGKDVVGIANTGTGKTAAFLIPLIDKVLRDSRENILII